MSSSREASHAGSWYSHKENELSRQLDSWLDAVPSSTTPIGHASAVQGPLTLPTQGARAIIAPHAGYSYSGAAAAWAYKSIDWSNAQRVFLLGPSHHHYLTGAATTTFETYDTPLGSLPIDTELVQSIAKDWKLDWMSAAVDEAEHSLEMHLPYIYKVLSRTHDLANLPRLVPILIGSTSAATERSLGKHLAPYLADPKNVFVISSDFCHWGSRFRYTYYVPKSGPPTQIRAGIPVSDRPIHESIAEVDRQSMDAVESGSHQGFLSQLEATGNTVCGRHPIGVFLAAVETSEGIDRENARFKFVRYERSSLVQSVRDSSVSYASAFAVLS
ncbi:UPF0103-domain-containing protein [Aaosphaeria arxii CBS 175.79]|uniref:UPF0103-domain-containing protein n=1 Tax=Aaosphaeria arxii CBS 175.79 TaxID=1450172 RepID=A0A6A5X8P3_9PLEO|nr:UPF0103-domain-containing protein [Aaosphaeria arxii CBS 175.79]KAF2009328.1 UPF0103-domain-containing protein [Aaosphaeria arxii CBS 175.79]